MGLTPTRVNGGDDYCSLGKFYASWRDITFDNSYPSGGEVLSPALFGFRPEKKPLEVSIVGHDVDAAPFRILWDKDNGKLLVYRAGGGILNYAPGGGDIKGSANTDVGIASGTLPTNGGLISNLANAANTTTMTIALSPDVGRNISVSFKNTNVGASTGNAVSCVITGTWRGAAQTETISFSALELTSTAQNEVATKYGSKPFDTVTSITNPVAQPANWQHAAGIGSKIGLPQDLLTPLEADVLKLTKNGANLSPSGIVSTTNMTVNFGTLADGDDVAIEYRAAVEVPSTTDLSALTVRVRMVG